MSIAPSEHEADPLEELRQRIETEHGSVSSFSFEWSTDHEATPFLLARLVNGGVWREPLTVPQGSFLLTILIRMQDNEVPLADDADPVKLADFAIASLPNRSGWDETVGPFFDTAGLGRWRGVSKQRLGTLRAENRLIGLRAADGRTLIYPRFQFDDRGRLLPRLQEVWPILTSAYGEWSAASWLNVRLAEWGDRTAAEVLRSGTDEEADEVIREARHDAAGMRQ